MSKPDPAEGNLEDVLASIRRSLSEQSTDALSEAAAAAARPAAQRREGLARRLASATLAASAAEGARAQGDDLSDLLESAPPAGSVAAAPPAPQSPPASAPPTTEKDPLWFLTRSSEPATQGSNQPAGVDPPGGHAAVDSAPVTEAKVSGAEAVRAPLPPFFGSSAEAAKADVVAAEPAASATGALQPAGSAPATVPSGGASAMAHEASLVAAAVEAAAASPLHGATSLPPVANGRAEAEPPAGAGPAASSQAFEAMVLDLLRPMLRQWLDQNMPRLIAQALKDEAGRSAPAERGTKRS
jgi:cell pole-organizing protein PopZ